MNNKNLKSGFTLIELLTVIGIFSMVASAAFVTLNGTRSEAILEEAEAIIIQAFGEAQNKAATGVGNTNHGVHIEGNKIISFEGDTYIPGTGEERILPQPISTNHPDTTIIFSRITAKPDISIAIILSHINGSTKTITITNDGVIFAD